MRAHPQEPLGALPGPASSGSGGSAEVEAALQAFSRISDDLVAGYDALRVRAEEMEAELMRTNAELASKVGELEAVLEALPSGVLVRDAEGRIVRTNDAALTLLGDRDRPVLGSLELPEVLEGRVLDQTGDELLLEVEREDGQRLVLARRTAPVHSGKAGLVGSVEVLDDRTALTEMAERVHQLDKMAALGTMAGGIAHEIRNPMNAIKGFAHLILRQVEAEGTLGRFAARICEGVAEADTIIASMLTLAAPEKLELEQVDVAELLEEVSDLCRRELGEQRLRIEVESPHRAITCDRIKLRQALRNLVQNATDVQPGEAHVRLVAEALDGSLLLHVHDAGPGIPADLRRRVLEPFFTTRAEGTGLGLALVHTIAELHGGSLELPSSRSPLGGAHVLLRLPLDTNTGLDPTPRDGAGSR